MRRADALCALVAQHQQQALAPSCGGDRPRGVVTLRYDTLLAARITAGAINPDGNRPPRADLQVEGVGPTCPGSPHATPGNATKFGLRGELLETGTPISAGELHRLACDADVLPIILGGDSEILDVGRSQRLVTPRDPGSADPARQRLCVPRLPHPRSCLPRPPPHPLVGRRKHLDSKPDTRLRPPPRPRRARPRRTTRHNESGPPLAHRNPKRQARSAHARPRPGQALEARVVEVPDGSEPEHRRLGGSGRRAQNRCAPAATP